MKNETITIDVPMLEARGVRRVLERAINAAEGHLAYRERIIPLRRHFTIRGDRRITAVLRRYLDKRQIPYSVG